jgi:hypothetical protein
VFDPRYYDDYSLLRVTFHNHDYVDLELPYEDDDVKMGDGGNKAREASEAAGAQ